MAKRTHIAGIKILAAAMLIYYGGRFFPGFFPSNHRLSSYDSLELLWGTVDLFEHRSSLLTSVVLFLIAGFCMFSVALAYLIASAGILRLKEWARKLAVYNSCFSIAVYFLSWLMSVFAVRSIAYFAPIDMEYVIFGSLFPFLMYLVLPSLFILLFLTRPEIKDSFTKDITQESKGVTIFAILVIILALLGGGRDRYEFYTSLYKISEPYVDILFWFDILREIIILLTAIGLFWLKNAFRKIVVILLLLDLVCSPFELFLIDEAYLFSDAIMVFLFVVFFIIFVLFDAAFIFFFTRPRVKEQFEHRLAVQNIL